LKTDTLKNLTKKNSQI